MRSVLKRTDRKATVKSHCSPKSPRKGAFVICPIDRGRKKPRHYPEIGPSCPLGCRDTLSREPKGPLTSTHNQPLLCPHQTLLIFVALHWQAQKWPQGPLATSNQGTDV